MFGPQDALVQQQPARVDRRGAHRAARLGQVPAVVELAAHRVLCEFAEAEGDVAVAERPRPFVRGAEKVGRNDSCPCGSGKKYKHCHGRLT